MTIIGVGTDLVKIKRIKAIFLKFGVKFINKILSEQERLAFLALPSIAQHAYLAKRFAAKEAVVKALGTGFRACGFKQISVLNDVYGKPYIEMEATGKALLASVGAKVLHISLSDEKEYALAFVIASA